MLPMLVALWACSASPRSSQDGPVRYGSEIAAVYPHDPRAFTQGLAYGGNGILYEGTGIRGESSLRKVQLESGEVSRMRALPERYFGEGIALWEDEIIQLTWRSNVGFVYERESFRLLKEFSYPTEGWGITHDGERLIMSDGSDTLYLLNPESFEGLGEVHVQDGEEPLDGLNELEYIDGEVYANVWPTDRIAIIDPDTGQVTGWIDLAGLLSEEDRAPRTDVLNGIAYDRAGDRLFVTGKYWPKLFQIERVRR